VIIISYVEKARNCVVCGKEFQENDDVVFCPECGAPHHRECWKEQGHCYYEAAHGTDLQWHPKEPPKEETQMPEPDNPTQTPPSMFFFNGTPMGKCSHCGRIVEYKIEESPCPHCGQTIQALPDNFQGSAAHATPLSFLENVPQINQPVDGIEGKKLARVVMQKSGYYLPRFRSLKKQGKGIVSWNWSAFLLAPYWFAFRKYYLWSAFAAFFDLLSFILMLPMTNQLLTSVPQNANYTQMLETALQTTFSPAILLLAQGGILLLLLRGVLFGLLGTYIYKTECIKRIAVLDELPSQEANTKIFKLGGVNLFAPIMVYYLLSIAQNIILSLF
jgi:DNA-directed RNA polymerase subunit RPC12/RpoP